MLLIIFSVIFGTAHCNAAQELLPITDRCIVECEHLPGGLSHNIIKYKTSLGNYYIFRQGKKRGNKDRFNRVVSIAQQVAKLQLAPYIYNFNDTHQQILMSYIPNVAWPSYEENEQPYGATMHMLRKFHDGLRSEVLKSNPTTYQPFSAILDREKYFIDDPNLPHQFKVAFDRVKISYEKVQPWLKTNATIYHGDLKKKNVLLEQKDDQLRPWLIDFEYAAVGHPYFD
ncbi:MAG: phosphotransferase, partial [Candidatus Babeliales bacterium]